MNYEKFIKDKIIVAESYGYKIKRNTLPDVMIKFPKKEISVCFDTDCDLDKLNKDETVCYGDGKNFYFVLKDLAINYTHSSTLLKEKDKNSIVGFENYIAKVHPDPDSVLIDNIQRWEQIVLLAENYAKQSI